MKLKYINNEDLITICEIARTALVYEDSFKAIASDMDLSDEALLEIKSNLEKELQEVS